MLGLALRSLRRRFVVSLVSALALALGIASLGASLGVGEALERELASIARQRRGEARGTVAFARPISAGRGEALAGAADGALIFDLPGRARVPEGAQADVGILGVDAAFFRGQRLALDAPSGRDAFVSRGLADALGVNEGDFVLLAAPRAAAVSSSLLFGDRSGRTAVVRARVTKILDASNGGEFTLRPGADAPRTILLSRRTVADAFASGDSGNTITLFAGTAESGATRIAEAWRASTTLEDHGLRLDAARDDLVLHSDAAALDAPTERAGRAAFEGLETTPVFVYLAVGIDKGPVSAPYSVVAGLPRADIERRVSGGKAAVTEGEPVWLSEWTARDLRAGPGDAVTLAYEVWLASGRLDRRTAAFTVAGLVPSARAGLDRALVPTYPGISDAESLAEWDPPFPIELNRIRPKDEAFWDEYGPSPKAYVDIETARRLFGESGSRLTALVAKGAAKDRERVEAALTARLRALAPPFVVRDLVLGRAASGALDFRAYFAGFSSFLILSSLLVAAAFVRFMFETRARELGVLSLVGFPPRDIRRLCLAEAGLIAALGAALGLMATPLAAAGVARLLAPVWSRSVASVDLSVGASTMAVVAALGFALALAALALALRATLRRAALSLLLDRREEEGATRRRLSAPMTVAGFAAVAVTGIALVRAELVPEGPGFFLVGAGALGAGLGWFAEKLRRVAPVDASAASGIAGLGFRGLAFHARRTVLVAALLAGSSFVVFAVSSFTRGGAIDRTARGPIGGYALFVETAGPVFDDLGTEAGRAAAGLPTEFAGQFARFRLKEGEDASCLNLHAPKSPRMLGVDRSFRDAARFSFAAVAAREGGGTPANPWTLLETPATIDADGGRTIPAVVDSNSLQYLFHMKLGDVFATTDGRGRPLRLRFVASLAETAIRSEILVAEEAFADLFPEVEGYRAFLVDVGSASAHDADRVAAATEALREAWRDRGAIVTSLEERLRRYYEVENTYLRSFQALGILAAALATLTLVATAARSVFERRSEFFVLRTQGYRPAELRRVIATEVFALAGAALVIGGVATLLALAPLPRAARPDLALALLFPLFATLSTALAAVVSFRVLDAGDSQARAIG